MSDHQNVPAKRSYDDGIKKDNEPEVQVVESPSPVKKASSGAQKRPTSRFGPSGRLTGINGQKSGYKPPGSLDGTRSPYFGSSTNNNTAAKPQSSSPFSTMSFLQKYSQRLDAKPTPVQRSPAVPGSNSSTSSNSGLISSKPLSSPAAPTPLSDNQKSMLSRLQSIFKNASPQDLRHAVRNFSVYNDAADWLAKRQSSKGQGSANFGPSNGSEMRSSKVQVDKSSKTIAQRYGAATGSSTTTTSSSLPNLSRFAPSFRRQDDGEEDELNLLKVHSQSKKRLVQGSKLPTPAPTKPHSSTQTPEPVVAEAAAQDVFTSESEGDYESEVDEEFEHRLLDFLNTAAVTDLADIASTTDKNAEALMSHRPFDSVEQAQEVRLTELKSGSRKRPEGEKIVNEISSTLKGYEAVDSLIQKCENVGNTVKKGISQWGVNVDGEKNSSEISLTSVDDEDEDGDDIKHNKSRGGAGGTYFHQQPKLLAEDVELKTYQQVGVNWINLLYTKKLSCILADEMGLGKTCQVIAFLAHLKEVGEDGPHLVVVPASTLENWLREFRRFCPSLKIEPYYGSQNERIELRDALIANETQFDVMVTTYNLACGSKEDHGFLRSRGFNVCIYDEGHLLKNSDSERYNKLMRLRANFRLLLTGTPLQNNLKELISLLSFILPEFFNARKQDLSLIFKHRALVNAAQNGRNPLLSEQRITKAKAMMTPFVLRRKKDQVLQHLPQKSHATEYCTMNQVQATLYEDQLQAARERVAARDAGESVKMVNLIMDLRKAAVHPLLFRKNFTDDKLQDMAKDIMREPVYREANEQYIREDMGVMNDYELQLLCEKFPNTIGKYKLPEEYWMESAKIRQLEKILPEMHKNGDRVLIFSQFTQVLDILERALSNMELKFLRMDGSTAVDVRQDMIDKFYQEKDIPVFLLSTRAGGFGINLACANTVIIHDLSFNPHDDKQAEDRAHRVGQTRPVKVIRLITKDTIDENILQLANTKLALDASVTENEAENSKKEQSNASIVADMVFNNKTE